MHQGALKRKRRGPPIRPRGRRRALKKLTMKAFDKLVMKFLSQLDKLNFLES